MNVCSIPIRLRSDFKSIQHTYTRKCILSGIHFKRIRMRSDSERIQHAVRICIVLNYKTIHQSILENTRNYAVSYKYKFKYTKYI